MMRMVKIVGLGTLHGKHFIHYRDNLRNWTDGKVMIDDEIIHTCCQK